MSATESYLEELRRELAGTEPATRDALLADVAATLSGLDEASARERMRALGDPARIAASVRAEDPAPQPDPVVAPAFVAAAPARASADPAWYAVLTVLLIAIGGVVVPFVGWAAGIVLLWGSRTWTRNQKWFATLAPLIGGALAGVLTAIANAVQPQGETGENPLLPTVYSSPSTILLTMVAVNVCVGIWLLRRR